MPGAERVDRRRETVVVLDFVRPGDGRRSLRCRLNRRTVLLGAVACMNVRVRWHCGAGREGRAAGEADLAAVKNIVSVIVGLSCILTPVACPKECGSRPLKTLYGF